MAVLDNASIVYCVPKCQLQAIPLALKVEAQILCCAGLHTLFCKGRNVSVPYKLAHVHNTKFQINGYWELNVLSQIREQEINRNSIRSLLKPSLLLQAKPACCSHRSMFIWYN